MIAVTLAKANTLWRRIERLTIMLLAAAFVFNTIAELADGPVSPGGDRGI
jgi:hypothetical protein